MRHPGLASLSFLVVSVSLALSGCGSTQMGSSLAGNNSSQSGTPPTVSAVAVQVNGVAPNRKQEVQFSEAMDPSTINTQSFQVADSSGKAASGTVTYDPAYNIASFQPSPALTASASYTGTITTAAASSSGAHLAQPYTFEFTTRASTDTSPLMVDAVTPFPDAPCVSATAPITVDFNESPDASTVTAANFMVTGPSGAIAVKISMDVATTKVVLTPASPLPSGSITVTVSNVADLAGVKMTAPFTWSFSTACNGGGGGTNTFVYAGNSTKIEGFQVAADGSLTAVPGSPFALAANALAASPNGNFLFSAGQTGPSTGMAHYTYSVASDGTLSTASSTTQIPPNPVNGTLAVALGWVTTDRTGATLYGAEVNGSQSSGYQWMGEYAIDSSGSLSLLGAADAQDDVSPLTFTPDNRYAYFVGIPPMSNPSGISFLTRNSDGTLTEKGSLNLALPAGAPPASGPAWAVVSPVSNYLAVVYQQNGMAGHGIASGIAVYPINSDGSAGTPTPYLPLNNSGGGRPMVWDSSGSYLFVGDGAIIYEVRFDSSTNTVALISQTTVGSGPNDLSFLNGHLFLANQGDQNLYVYNFANGVLTSAPGSPVSLGFNAGIVALQR